jgi:hypothetical protein
MGGSTLPKHRTPNQRFDRLLQMMATQSEALGTPGASIKHPEPPYATSESAPASVFIRLSIRFMAANSVSSRSTRAESSRSWG